MTETERLAAIEAIKQAKAKYWRGVDLGDGDLVKSVLAEDCELDYHGCCVDPQSGIDHLPAPRLPGLEQRGQNAHNEIEAPATVIADQVQRRDGLIDRSDGVESPSDGDVIDVVAGRLRERAVLPPASHACIDQPRITRGDDVWTETQPLHDARTEALYQHVSVVE